MKNLFFKDASSFRRPIALAALLGLSASTALAATNNYFGTSGLLTDSVWSAIAAGPYTSPLDSTGGAILNFGNPATSVLGGDIVVAGINATANVTNWTAGGTISNVGDGVVSLNVSTGATLDFGAQAFTSAATAGYTKDGAGVLALSGGSYGGGFTLNTGTVIARSSNALGFGGVLTINGGVLAADASRDFTGNFTGITIGGNFTLGANTGLAASAANLTFASNVALGATTRTVTLGGSGTYTFNGAVSGTAGLTVNSTTGGTLVFGGANTYSGATTVSGGTLTYAGSAGSTGAGTLTVSGTRPVVNLNSTGNFTFNGSVNLGAAGQTGVINQSAGTVNVLNNTGYIMIGNGGYGAYALSGGTLNTTSASGIRLGTGAAAQGVYLQTGGTLNLTRYLSVGNTGTGVATITSGTLNTSTGNFGILIGDGGSATNVFNLGTLAGGDGVVVSQSAGGNAGIAVGSNAAAGILNIDSGTLRLTAATIRKGNAAATLNLNGGLIQAGANNLTLIDASMTTAAGVTPVGVVKVYRGGAAFDTGANTATVAAGLTTAAGNGVYVPGGTLAVGTGAGYTGAPLVAVTGGTGTGATAIAQVSNGVVTGVALTNPGENYTAGDVLSFAFSGGGFSTAAPTFTYTLKAADVAANNTGTLTKSGTGTLNMTGTNSYSGATKVTNGTLVFSKEVSLYNATVASWTADNLVVSTGATLGFNVGGTGEFISSDIDALKTLASPTGGFKAGASIGFDTTNAAGGVFTYPSVIPDTTNGALGVAKLGTNTLLLTAANIYTGVTSVRAGTLTFGKEVALYNNNHAAWTADNLVVANGATAGFNVGGPDEFTTSDLDGLKTIASPTGGFQAGSSLGIDTTNAPLSTFNYSSVIGDTTNGALGLAKLGSGTLVITTSNTYTGPTSIRGGTLQIGDGGITGSLGATSSIVTAGGILAINHSDAFTVALPISGTGGFSQVGAGVTAITGTNTYTGATSVTNGTLVFSGAAASTGGGTLTVSGVTRATLKLNSTGTLTFNGSAVIGNTGNVGAIEQTSGTVNLLNNAGYLMIGNGGYGSYMLSGGALNTTGTSGFRVGGSAGSQGVFWQTGGTLNLTRYFALGTGGSSGEATILGGQLNGAASFGILIGDNGSNPNGVNGVFNLGTQAGGTGLVVSQSNANSPGVNVGFGAPGILNLNSGTLRLAAASIKRGSAAGTVNIDGGTIQAGADALTLIDSSLSGSVNLYRHGLVVDTQANNATIAASLSGAMGQGVYPTGGTLTVNGGSGYIGAPQVVVSGGSGSGARAVANLSNGVVSSVALTVPGQNYQVGDVISFVFSGGGAAVPADPLVYTLTAADLATSDSGGLTKIGAGSLTLSGSNTYNGLTNVMAGRLIVNGAIASPVTVQTSGSLAGNGSVGGLVTIANGGKLEPGVNGAGTLTAVTNLTLSSGSILNYDLLGNNPTIGSGVNDLTAVFGDFTLDGTLNVTELTPGSFLAATQGNRWELFSYGSGAFNDQGLNLGTMPTLSPGLAFAIDTSFPYEVDLVVVPEPGATLSLCGGLGLLLWARRRRR